MIKIQNEIKNGQVMQNLILTDKHTFYYNDNLKLFSNAF